MPNYKKMKDEMDAANVSEAARVSEVLASTIEKLSAIIDETIGLETVRPAAINTAIVVRDQIKQSFDVLKPRAEQSETSGAVELLK
jgi:hypothetical protein